MVSKARIIIGSNYGDEGKGTVTAHYTKNSFGTVLNVLTNGGAQRGHSIISDHGSHTFKHFGSGTYHGASSYCSRFFILNPMQFVKEWDELIIKPSFVYRHTDCMWSTPYDMVANSIIEEQKGSHASCQMGIWNTIKRYKESGCNLSLSKFVKELTYDDKLTYLAKVKSYYDNFVIDTVPNGWRDIWNSDGLVYHFLADCDFVYDNTVEVFDDKVFADKYDNLIFENGQGLLLSDTGEDRPDKTPSNTGITYSKLILSDMGLIDKSGVTNKKLELTAHYVTRPYLTRHGDGKIENYINMKHLSEGVCEDRTNHYNTFQGKFRYGSLDIIELKDRIAKDAGSIPYELDVTHCDEMDRIEEFNKIFTNVNTYEKPEII